MSKTKSPTAQEPIEVIVDNQYVRLDDRATAVEDISKLYCHQKPVYFNSTSREYLLHDRKILAPYKEEAILNHLFETVNRVFETAQSSLNEEKLEQATKILRPLQRMGGLNEILHMIPIINWDRHVTSEQLDANSNLVNLANGTIDLESPSFELRNAVPGDFITRQMNVTYNPDAQAPTFRA
jgi:phage/plasmid-associated DNA primase